MSYCRMEGSSDCYVIATDTAWVCISCALQVGQPLDESAVRLGTPGEMHDHLLDHRRAGHGVPQEALDDLRAEGGWGP